tara:strand:+ start:422 stop:1174 length:753 start_codon:yes stop_codon:yes gene_type:complete
MSTVNQQGITSISELPMANQQTNMGTQPIQTTNSNIILTKNEIVSDSNNQMQNPVMQQQQQQMQQQQMQQQQQQMQQQMQQQPSLPNNIDSASNSNANNYNELVNQIQKASISGVTSLPSRDIPMDPHSMKNDVEVKPNYIPQSNISEDYINNLQTPDNLINENNNIMNNLDNLDMFYREFQLPLLIAIIYFLFQLPAVRKYSHKFIPALFKDDGNPNLYGYIFNSIAFASLFYVLVKVMNQVTASTLVA